MSTGLKKGHSDISKRPLELVHDSPGRLAKTGDFLSVFAFLKAHSRCYATEKGEKWRKMNRF
jgi:hypothetical protein